MSVIGRVLGYSGSFFTS